MIFENRKDAGTALAMEFIDRQQDKNTVVLGLPRGGVVVAEQVARSLRVPLDVILLRKLPYPPQPELAIGAVAEQGAVWINEEFRDAVRSDPNWLQDIIRQQQSIIQQRATLYRSHRHARNLQGKTVILVDDGIATGATMKVAVMAVRSSGAAKVIVAVPVAARSSVRELQEVADEVVCLGAPEDFCAVGQAYQSFDQVTDNEVISILDRNP